MRLQGPLPFARTLALRLALFSLLWWVLTEGQPGSWPLGGLFVVLATGLSLTLSRPVPWSAVEFARFVPFFLWWSLRGGIDVAWRACVPSLPIAPGILTYRLRLPPGRARVFLTAVISLLPGTLSAEIARNNLCVHILDKHVSSEAELAVLETKVAALFRIRLTKPPITQAEKS
jgi:multicomponent Na+:H+ antiporter subunit E